MIKILHVTPHMGGGVGNIISRIVNTEKQQLSHTVILLEKPRDVNFISRIEQNGIKTLMCPDQKQINECIRVCDIVVVHWWHHPKTSLFLYNFPKVPARLIIWSHISNLTVPSLAPEFIMESTRVLFTTEASFRAWNYRLLDSDIMREKSDVVPGCGGIDSSFIPRHNEHKEFNIGFLGYIDFSKMHHDFIAFCKAVDIPQAQFILAGNAPAQKELELQAKSSQLINPLVFSGYVTDINSIFADWDIFGYPLMPMHTCTTENTIIEAMAAEVPPVLLNQLTERYIVKNMETGLLVTGVEEYGNAIRYLYENPEIRTTIGRNARRYVMEKYTFEKILNLFIENCELAMNAPQRSMCFRKILGNSPSEWFSSCLGEQAGMFFYRDSNNQKIFINDKSILDCSPLLKLERKSSILHYAEEFHDDAVLTNWARIILEGGNSAG